jgi:N-acetylglucosamine kinase-like BadF-type ATPase
MIKKSAEIEIKSNASATKADIDNLSNSTDKLSNSTKNSSKSIIDNSAMDIAKHINRWFSRSKKCC